MASRTLPNRATDAQRGKVYEAEHLVHRIFDRAVEFPTVEVAGSRLTLPVERRFADLSSVQTYVEKVLGLRWVGERWRRAEVPVTVRERAGRTSAHYQRIGAVMAVPGVLHGDQWAMRELVVLHELAHHLADDGPDEQTNEPHHGPGYVGRLLELAGGIIGPEAELLLRINFAEIGAKAG